MEKIEVYYDPSGFLPGKADRIMAVGEPVQQEAKLECVKTAKSFGKSGDYDSYELVNIGKQIDNPGALPGIIDIVPWHRPGKV